MNSRNDALQRGEIVLPVSPPGQERPDESLRKFAVAGWVTVGAFFGIFGIWSLTAPLNGAVVANAVVKVQGNRKSVQHLDGGIVKQLNIKEGDHVKSGDVLIVLDDSEARAEYDVLAQQVTVLTATEARLEAEFNHRSSLALPHSTALLGGAADSGVWNAQMREFQSRQAAIEGQRQVIREKIHQIEEQIIGSEQQIASYKQQEASVHKELDSITPLVERGLIAQSRQNQLERSAFGLDGQIAGTTADIARDHQAIAEQTQQIAQLENDRMTDVTKDLQDAHSQLLELIPRLANAKAVLGRTQIRAPYGGQVVALNVFGIGAVIEKGEKILDIVPDNDGLDVEARIPVDAISDVHPGQRAEIRLTAYKQRITPMIHGDITEVSADRLTDERTNTPYYTAQVMVDQSELDRLPNIRLYPGMPANVLIPTVERTAFDYLVEPLTMSFTTAFRQK